MKVDKLLSRKLQKLNILKGNLVARQCENKEQVITDIKETVEDIELILEDSDQEKEQSREKKIIVAESNEQDNLSVEQKENATISDILD